jgi:hypothetical protein
LDSADSLHLQMEAVKLAFADIYEYVSDADTMRVKSADLLDQAYLLTRSRLIDMKKAQTPRYGVPASGGTVYLTAADAMGMMVSYIQSNYHGFGSGIVVDGISMQNRGYFGDEFSWRDVILIGGGLFLIAKATFEIHSEIDVGEHHERRLSSNANGILLVIVQIALIDLVFSIDSIVTAIGMVQHVEVMIAAVLISMAVMYGTSGSVTELPRPFFASASSKRSPSLFCPPRAPA